MPITLIRPTGEGLARRLREAIDGAQRAPAFAPSGFVVALLPREMRRGPGSTLIRQHAHDVPVDDQPLRDALLAVDGFVPEHLDALGPAASGR